MSTRVISTCLQFIDAFSKPSAQAIENMRKMGRELQQTGKNIQNAGKTISSAGASLTKSITVPVAGIGVTAVKTASDYESAMSNVKAITGSTGKDFKQLTQLGKDLGASTAWSAKECAEAMQYTGMAGWSAKENVAGLKGILDLASASGTELARTSDIMTDAISAFGDTAADSGRYADVMTAACTSANVSVNTLGESYKYVGSLAGSMGYEVDQVTTALAAMGNQGIKGSAAGTALRSAITNMSAPTKAMKEAMDKLGISLTDGQGQMKTFEEVIDNIQGSFKGLTADQQAAYAKTIFGKSAMSGMLAVINTSTKDYDKLATAISNSGGAAEKAANTQLDNLKGQMTLLKSALEGAAITIGDKLLPFLKKAVGVIQNVTNWFNSLSDSQVEQIMKWAGIAAAVGPALVIFGKVVTTVGTVTSTIGKVSSAISKAGSVMGLLTSPAGIVIAVLAAVALAAFLIIKNWDKVKPVLMKVKEAFGNTFSMIAGVVKNAISTIKPVINTLINTFKDILPKAIGMIKTAISSVTPVFKTIVRTISTVASTIAKTFISVAQKLQPVFSTICNVIKAAIPIIGKMLGGAFTFVSGVISKVMPPIKKVASAIGGLIVYAVKAASPVISKLAGVFSAVFTKIFSVVKTVVNKLKPVFNVIGTVVKAVMSIVKNRIGNTFKTISNIIVSVVNGIKSIIGGLMKVFSGIIDFITGVFTGNWSKAWEGVKSIFTGIFDGLVGYLKIPINGIISIVNGAIEGLNGISIDIPEGVPLVGGKHFGFNIPLIPALAKGTDNWKGGPVQVHEKGGEIIDLPKGSRVYPHDKSVDMARKKSNITITIPKLADQIVVRNTQDIDDIADQIATKLKNVAWNMGGC